METFIPADYTIPTTSAYMKLKDGANTFRVLSSATVGYEYWNNENKPVRSKTPFTSTPDIKLDPKTGKPSSVKHFWAFVVYNYNDKQIQVFELTQKSIMDYMLSLNKNPKWGAPQGYDITITKTGSNLETKYVTTAEPHSTLDEKIKAEYESMSIDLTKLYTGENPFGLAKAEGEVAYPEMDNEVKGF